MFLGRANDCTHLLVKILKELLLVCGILFAKLVPIFAKIHKICLETHENQHLSFDFQSTKRKAIWISWKIFYIQ